MSSARSGVCRNATRRRPSGRCRLRARAGRARRWRRDAAQPRERRRRPYGVVIDLIHVAEYVCRRCLCSIATGVIEGACGTWSATVMEFTGARWCYPVPLFHPCAGLDPPGGQLGWVRLFFVDGFFTYSWAFLLADGHFSVRFARGQRPGQRPPASFGRPARPDHGARTLRSSPPPPWTFARRFGTLPWEGRCLCDGRSSDDEVLGTCLLGRVGCHQRSSSHGPTLPPCW